MTLLCIVFAVFLVTAVFSVADMGVRMETARILEKHGSQAVQKMLANGTVQNYFILAAILFVLILMAGVLMISSSINSNVAQRTQFFGMMRCVGMSRKQIIRFVRLEALNWCKTAIPIGVALGIVITWVLSAILRFLVGEEFTYIPLFGISLIGIVSGILVGVVSVLLAAGSPAKRAATVSPVAAVSGNSANASHTNHAMHTRFFRIETALGIHHAVAGKKSLLLMTGSFALSIILFLSFSVVIELVGYMMPQLSNDADISIISADGGNTMDHTLLNQLAGMDGVKRVFARRSLLDAEAMIVGDHPRTEMADLISYDDFDLDSLVKDHGLRKGSDIAKVYGDSQYVLAIWDQDNALQASDMVQVGKETLVIAGLLKYNPFSEDGSTDGKITLITSAETFARVTGITDYALILIQAAKDMTDDDVAAIRAVTDGTGVVSDKRDQRTINTYIAFVFFVYAFLAIITLVTVLNIMNNISMSVSARIKQYGAMRAVGMDERQITKMIAAESFSYASSGCAVGCTVGLLASRQLYGSLITSHYSYATWSVPVVPVVIILLFVAAAAIAAIYAPAKRMRNMAVIDTINEL